MRLMDLLLRKQLRPSLVDVPSSSNFQATT